MQLEAFLLCDYASDQDGKLTVVGAFDTIKSYRLPAMHPLCAVVVRFRVDPPEETTHRVLLTFLNPESTAFAPALEKTLTGPYSMTPRRYGMVIGLQALAFQYPGQYCINLSVDGKEIATYPFTVQVIPPASIPPNQ